MDAARYRAARALFEELVELDAAARAEALARVEDAALRAEVQALLAADAAPVELDPLAHGGLPERLGPYTVRRELGRGAMGVVYEAEEAAPRRRVALKVLHPRLRTPATERLAREEAQALAELAHPGIPRVWALVETELGPAVVMELVEGAPLAEAAQGLDEAGRLRLLEAVCAPVAAAHARGVVHRDLKPANVLVTAEGQPVVLDFGIAASGAAPGAAPPPGPLARAGTPAYMAPEQARGEAPSPASDVWSLGVLGWELLTGRLPTAGDPGRELREDLRAVLRRALAADPGQRYPDAGGLAEELARVAANRPVRALPGAGPALRAFGRRRRGLLLAGGLGLGLLVLVAPSGWRALQVAERERRLGAWAAGEGPPDAAWVEPLLHDPALLGTEALAEAWARRGGGLDEDGALRALGWSWAVAPEDDARARARLAAALREAGRSAAAAAVSPLPAAVFVSEELDPGPTQGALDPAGAPLGVVDGALQRPAGPVPLPGAVFGVEWSGAGTLLRGVGWVRRVGAAEEGWGLPGEVADVLAADLEGDGLEEVYATVRFGEAGVWALRPGAEAERLPVTAGLPARGLAALDTDGDGAHELLVAATGWAGHELRVLGRGPTGWATRGRLRLGAWDVAVGPDGRAWVLGGPLPRSPAPLASRRWLVPVAFTDGVARAGPPLRLPVEVVRLEATPEGLVLGGLDEVGFLPVGAEGVGELRWVEGVRLVAAGPGGVWVRTGEGAPGPAVARLLHPGREGHALPIPPAAPLPPGPAGLSAAATRAWGRAARLATLPGGPLLHELGAELLRGAGLGPEVLPAGAGAGAGAGATAQAEAAHTLFLGRVAAALGAGLDGPAAPLLHAAHTFELPPRFELLPDRPLPAVARVGAPGTLRRLPVPGRLALDLLGSDPVALALPLEADGGPVCVGLELDVRQLDWSAGLSVTLRRERAITATFWRVGGGPAEGHTLSWSAGGAGDSVPWATGPHTIELCVSEAPEPEFATRGSAAEELANRFASGGGPAPREPRSGDRGGASAASDAQKERAEPGGDARIGDRVSVRLDGRERRVGSSPGLGGPGPLWLELGPALPEGAPERRAELDLRRLVTAGAGLAEGPAGDAAALARAEGGAPAPAPPLGDRAAVLALLRREPRAAAALPAPWRAEAWPLLAEAWSIPLTYDRLDAGRALGGGTLPEAGPLPAELLLARALARLDAGDVTGAEAALLRLGEDDAEGWILRARLAARRGQPEVAREALRRLLLVDPSPSTRDRLVDDPELRVFGVVADPAPIVAFPE